MKLQLLALATGALLSLGIATPAAAGPLEDHIEAALAARARISPADAADIARRHVKEGRVTSLDLDIKRGRLVYEVEVVTTEWMEHEVYVDANSGRVVASRVEWDD